MSDIATFFRHREKHPGETYQIDVGSCRFYVYARKAIPRNLVKQIADRKEPDQGHSDLRSAIVKNGGVIVKTTAVGSETVVDVEWVGMKDSAPAREFVVLSPGRPPRFEKGEQKLPANSHVLVPVERDAENALHQFLGHLEWLSIDLETLVLNALRRPSLDARLNNVERKSFGLTSDEAQNAGWFKRAWAKLKLSFTPAVFGMTTGVLVAILLGANAYLFWGLHSRLDDLSGQTPGMKEKKEKQDSAEQQVSTPRPQDGSFVDETKTLMTGLLGKRASNPDLNLLYETHFAALYKDNLTDEQIARLFEKTAENRPFLWGLIKLQALKLEPKPADQSFLKDADEITFTKTRFTEIGTTKIDEDGNGLRLLAALSCRLGYDTPNVPGLPEVKGRPALEFVPNGKCADYQASTDIENGLAGLIEFVERDDHD